ncbi:hypothetical protein RhiirA5_433293 [Rhizophagus irregularis]|uniref:Uncharacterized protein n=3 Tax=Rhizophagus irregularis TaxID=588596 RepID=A0A2N0NRZ7_9GLOM|nr:hypothetical protein RhiirA5_433293 [Rhizophagus irregularis]PKC55615.1 hypothetical protein RhiirA1_475299 [Rhizophagus irregularis]
MLNSKKWILTKEQIAYNNGFERRIERLENNLKSAQEHSNNLKAKINQLTSTIEIQRHWIDELQQKHNTFIENEETIISRLTSNEDGLRKFDSKTPSSDGSGYG